MGWGTLLYYSIAGAQQPLRVDTRSTATSSHAGGGAFRLDINALRALSVLAVLGYHLKIPRFAGGFVGVDVFLVITGYLMTAKVLADLAANRFSLWSFGMHEHEASSMHSAAAQGASSATSCSSTCATSGRPRSST